MLICTVKPSAVGVGLPNVGVKAAIGSDLETTVNFPVAYPIFVVVIVADTYVSSATPVTVIKPSPIKNPVNPVIPTAPEVAVPDHV